MIYIYTPAKQTRVTAKMQKIKGGDEERKSVIRLTYPMRFQNISEYKT